MGAGKGSVRGRLMPVSQATSEMLAVAAARETRLRDAPILGCCGALAGARDVSCPYGSEWYPRVR